MRPPRLVLIAALFLGLAAAGCGGSGKAVPLNPSALSATVTPASAGPLLQVQLPPVEAAPGTSTLHIAVRPPEGFDVSGDAPSRLTLAAANRSVVDLGEPEVAWNADVPDAGLPVPVNLALGSTTLTATGTVYFCRAGEESLCRIQRIELTLPVTVSRTSATGDFELAYRLPPLSSP